MCFHPLSRPGTGRDIDDDPLNLAIEAMRVKKKTAPDKDKWILHASIRQSSSRTSPVIIPWPLPGLLMNLSVTFSAHISATLLDLSVSLASNCASALHHTRPVRVIGRTS
jgi:hypothetical protein